jgi:hypothetical protein
MYCTNCGNELPPGATACAHCAHPVPQFPPPASVPNYFVQALLVTLCCCPPFGIVALIFSAKVNSKLAAGDVAGAQDSSHSAKTWVIVSVIAAIILGAGVAALSWWQ